MCEGPREAGDRNRTGSGSSVVQGVDQIPDHKKSVGIYSYSMGPVLYVPRMSWRIWRARWQLLFEDIHVSTCIWRCIRKFGDRSYLPIVPTVHTHVKPFSLQLRAITRSESCRLGA